MLAIGYENISQLGKVVISIDSVRETTSVLSNLMNWERLGFSSEWAHLTRRRDYGTQ